MISYNFLVRFLIGLLDKLREEHRVRVLARGDDEAGVELRGVSGVGRGAHGAAGGICKLHRVPGGREYQWPFFLGT